MSQSPELHEHASTIEEYLEFPLHRPLQGQTVHVNLRSGEHIHGTMLGPCRLGFRLDLGTSIVTLTSREVLDFVWIKEVPEPDGADLVPDVEHRSGPQHPADG